MKTLKNYKVAWLIMAVVVVLSLCFGAVRSVRVEASKVERMFTEGVDGSGYGIAGDLEERADYAQRLMKIAGKYSGAEEEIEAVQEAVVALGSAGTPSEKYRADKALESAVIVLDLAMGDQGLSEQDEAYRSETMSGFESPGYKIDKEAVRYNEAVQAYEDQVLGGFVASLIGNMISLPEVEAYA